MSETRKLAAILVADVATTDAIRSALDASIAEIEGVLETFDALLRIGQIEAGARRAAFKPIDLAEIARDVVEAFQPAADEGGRTLVSGLEAPLPMLGDRELLTQMIANLLDNALRHTPRGVRIAVAGDQLAQGVCLTVEDQRTWGRSAGPARDLSALLSRGRSGELDWKRARPQPCGGDRRTARTGLFGLGQPPRPQGQTGDHRQGRIGQSGTLLTRRRSVRARACRRPPSLAQGFPDVAGWRARPRKDGREPATGRHGREPSAASER
jgi:hypothetical protein